MSDKNTTNFTSVNTGNDTKINDTKVKTDENTDKNLKNDSEAKVQSETTESKDACHNKKTDEVKEQLLRLAAELQNLKRRSEKERMDASKFAVSSFAKDILVVRDNLQLALKNCSATDTKIVEGVTLTLKHMDSILASHGITMINSVDAEFDPNFHQAVNEVDSEKKSGTIVEVMQEGFTINGRLLRPALVSVAK